MIRLHVPGTLRYRDLAVRVVSAACKLVEPPTADGSRSPAKQDFDHQVISAFGEAFNNAAIHSYRGRPAGEVEIEVDVRDRAITIRIADYGKSFDLSNVAEPDLDALPESGLGIFIIQSFMDEVSYSRGSGEGGARNVLSMTKFMGSGEVDQPNGGNGAGRPAGNSGQP
jgi:serine/threonine-protein kinase RsbW